IDPHVAAVYIGLARANVGRAATVPERHEAGRTDRRLEARVLAQKLRIRKPQYTQRRVRSFARETGEPIEYELGLLQRRAAEDLGGGVYIAVVGSLRDRPERIGDQAAVRGGLQRRARPDLEFRTRHRSTQQAPGGARIALQKRRQRLNSRHGSIGYEIF